MVTKYEDEAVPHAGYSLIFVVNSGTIWEYKF